jgi:hypothetical protein
LNIINPNLKIDDDNNIFTLRRREYNLLEGQIFEALQPVKEIGYKIEKYEINDCRSQGEELQKTHKKNLSIILSKDEAKVDLSINIPELIDDNYIFINGKRKIPHFQITDFPIITKTNKKSEDSFIIKFKSNVQTIILYEKKSIIFTFLNKKLSFGLLLLAYYGPEILNERFNLSQTNVEGLENNFYNRMIKEIYSYYAMNKTKDEYTKMLGESFTKYNAKLKGEEILYALDLIPKIDIITARFLKTGSIIEDFIDAIQNGPFDFLNFENKRIRCFEYLIFGYVAKAIFNLCVITKNSKPKFNINSSEILQHCNVSEIIQFDFSINPIDSLTELSRISLLGPNGFERKSVPENIRDINDSMFGRICVVDTPDRDNCGIVGNILSNSKLDSNMKFTSEIQNKCPISIPVTMVPFLEHDDQTRLQMAASQMRQAILLRKPEKPLIQSGCENLYTKYTNFLETAKKDGIVIYHDDDEGFIIVKYDDGEIELIQTGYKKIYTDNMDMMETNFKEGERFRKNDILVESLFTKDHNISIGRNLLTGIGIYHGYNYEDGIVISERLVEERVLSSIHYRDLSFFVPSNKILSNLNSYKTLPEEYDEYGERARTLVYKPLPESGEWIDVGSPYAVLKKVQQGNDFGTLFEEDESLISPKKMCILECNVYVNDYPTKNIPESFREWLENKIISQKIKEKKIGKILGQYLPKSEYNKFAKSNLNNYLSEGKYKIKGEKFDGIFVHLTGYYIRKIEVGDKIGNRHGNKGVISKIVKTEDMPKLPDGRSLDIIINPLGIISRMNIGQLFELHLAMSLVDLKNNMKTMLKKNYELLQMIEKLESEDDKIKYQKLQKDILSQSSIKKYLLKYIKIIDNTRNGWYYDQFKTQLKTIIIDEKFIDDLSIIQPPFESTTLKQCKKALSYTNTCFKYPVYDPIVKDTYVNEVAIGYLYFFRMIHIAEDKLSARGIGSYTKKTLQPTGGKRNNGGQRLGEMEVSCMIAHDSVHNLNESMTTKSDSIEAKNKWMYDQIDSGNKLRNETYKEGDMISESVRLLNSYLTVIGINKGD